MRGPPAVAEQWHCVPVSPASSGPAGRRGFSKQSGGPFARFDSRRITIFKPGTNFRAEVLATETVRVSPGPFEGEPPGMGGNELMDGIRSPRTRGVEANRRR